MDKSIKTGPEKSCVCMWDAMGIFHFEGIFFGGSLNLTSFSLIPKTHYPKPIGF